MKINDFKLYEQYFAQHPEAEEAPESIVNPEPAKPAEETPTVTVADLMKELEFLKTAVSNIQNVKPEEPTPNPEIEELRSSIRDLTSEMQTANQRSVEMPKQDTADDIIKKFIMGGN